MKLFHSEEIVIMMMLSRIEKCVKFRRLFFAQLNIGGRIEWEKDFCRQKKSFKQAEERQQMRNFLFLNKREILKLISIYLRTPKKNSVWNFLHPLPLKLKCFFLLKFYRRWESFYLSLLCRKKEESEKKFSSHFSLPPFMQKATQ